MKIWFTLIAFTFSCFIALQAQGTFQIVKDANAGAQDAQPRDLLSDGQKVYFLTEKTAGTGNLWISNQTTDDATLLLEFTVPLVLGAALNYEVQHNGLVYFGLDETTQYEVLWVSDGTVAGTKELERPEGGNFKALEYFFELNGDLYFLNYEANLELWTTDGTIAGTTLIKTFCSYQGNGTCYAQAMLNNTVAILNGQAYLFLKTPTYGQELWITDGTTSGTNVIDFIAGSGDFIFDYQRSIAYDGKVYFQSSNGNANTNSPSNTGDELHVTDGTLANTELFLDINQTNGSLANYFGLHSRAHNLYTDGDKFYFFAIDGINGEELYISDGTAAGTEMIGDIITGNTERGVIPEFYKFNNQVLFNYTDGEWNNQNDVPNTQLWTTNGTVSGTNVLKVFDTPYSPFDPQIEYNGELFFKSRSFENGREIWKTDGTSGGTVRLKNINAGNGHDINAVTPIVELNGLLYFFANNGNEDALWQSDGTEAGTIPVAIPTGTVIANALPDELVVVGNKLVFGANINNSGDEVWSFTPDVSTAILESELAVDVILNSNTNELKITSKEVALSTFQYKLVDVSGRVLQEQSLGNSGETATIQLPSVSSQIVIVHITDGQNSFAKKFLLN